MATNRSFAVTAVAFLCIALSGLELLIHVQGLRHTGRLLNVADFLWWVILLVASVGVLLRHTWARRALIGALALTAAGWVASTLSSRRQVVVITRTPIHAGDKISDAPIVGPFGIAQLTIIETVAVVVFAVVVIAVLSTRRARDDFDRASDAAA